MPLQGPERTRFAPCPLLSCAAVARLYDLMLILDPNAPEERQNAVLSNVESMIQSGGTLVGHHDWGVRRMSFEIDHRPEAGYHLFQFETEAGDLLERLDHSLKIADGVLRFRTIRLKPGSPPPPVPRQEAPRTRERAQDTRVAARAAADAPAEGASAPAEGAPAPAEGTSAPAEGKSAPAEGAPAPAQGAPAPAGDGEPAVDAEQSPA
jgi:small subunit ribosomal protein S6